MFAPWCSGGWITTVSDHMLCCAESLSHVRLFTTPRTIARQAPLSMGFSRQEYWNGLLCPPPGDLPNPGIERRSVSLLADSLPFETPGKHKSTERVAMPSSRGSSLWRTRTRVSCIAGGFFTSWATREAYIQRCKILIHGEWCKNWENE